MSADKCKHGVELSTICNECDDERTGEVIAHSSTPSGSACAAISKSLDELGPAFESAMNGAFLRSFVTPLVFWGIGVLTGLLLGLAR